MPNTYISFVYIILFYSGLFTTIKNFQYFKTVKSSTSKPVQNDVSLANCFLLIEASTVIEQFHVNRIKATIYNNFF